MLQDKERKTITGELTAEGWGKVLATFSKEQQRYDICTVSLSIRVTRGPSASMASGHLFDFTCDISTLLAATS